MKNILNYRVKATAEINLNNTEFNIVNTLKYKN